MSLEELYDNVLHKIGRNVLLFQQLEQLLKYIITQGSFAGYASEIEQIRKDSAGKIYKQTMGQLVKQYMENTHPDFEPKNKEPDVLKEPFISYRVSLEVDVAQYERIQKALDEMVVERNELIHHLLPNFDRSSSESCIKMIEKLDCLTERLRKEIASMNGQVSRIQMALKETVKLLDSEAGKRQLELFCLRQNEIVAQLLQYLHMRRRDDGWAPLAEAAQFVKVHAPDELAQIRVKHGYKSLKSLMFASELFDISNEITTKGGKRVLYRLREGWLLSSQK